LEQRLSVVQGSLLLQTTLQYRRPTPTSFTKAMKRVVELDSTRKASVDDPLHQFPDGLEESDTAHATVRLRDDDEDGDGEGTRELAVPEGTVHKL